MIVKVTNVKYFTGGGKHREAVPQRIRHNQNVTLNIPDNWLKRFEGFDLRWRIETYVKCRFITTKETKVHEWNYEMQREFRARQYDRRKLKREKRWQKK